ncbi:MAG TPA: hypothetical protein VK932_01520, partial [Kofleriaceae bacterium]|nr:hypothetical protein [Kofleriaceae bacterium]
DELVPFLMARSGKALDDFGRWVAPRRRVEWVIAMLEYLPMSEPTQEELLERLGPVDDPVIEKRRQKIARTLVRMTPEVKQELIDEGRQEGREEGRQEGRLEVARAVLRRVLVRRQLTPSQEESARIEACTDFETLERWLDRAVTAATVSNALT